MPAPGSDRVVLRDVRLDIRREDRVRIAGPNGAGKTTLLEALVRSRAGRSGSDARILYLPQELDPETVAAQLERLEECTAGERGRVLSVFAALGSDPERVSNPPSSRFLVVSCSSPHDDAFAAAVTTRSIDAAQFRHGGYVGV